jgi:glycosyltransferase involved in cell wall biosynthesis
LLFTVFTPAYNRRRLIHRVWDSLQAQTFTDFEWVIVDDGSSDNLIELLQEYAGQAAFPVRFERQENAGKHAAWNRGVEMARGELFVPIDSDDSFSPNSLETLKQWWLSIPEPERASYSGINVLCRDPESGKIVGDPYPKSPMVSNNLELTYVYRLTGEKWGCQRTAALREVPYPRDPAYRRHFISENYLWYQLARRYKVLCVNEPLRSYYRDAPNSTLNEQYGGALSARLLGHVPARYFYKSWHLNTNLDYLLKAKKDLAKTAIDIWVCGLEFRGSIGGVLRDGTGGAPLAIRLMAMPAGIAAYLYCKRCKRRAESARVATAGGSGPATA